MFSEAPKTPPRKPDSNCATDNSTGEAAGERFRAAKRDETCAEASDRIVNVVIKGK